MHFYSPRKIAFKAWHKTEKLLKRLDTIPCVRGELKQNDCILLQFTGLHDQAGEELYEMDVLLLRTEKLIIVWNTTRWMIERLSNHEQTELTQQTVADAIRLGNYFELNESV